MRRTPLTAVAALALLPALGRADVKPHPLISDGMVLQQGVECKLWGTADPGEEVGASFTRGPGGDALLIKRVKADADGKWALTLPKQKAGGPCTLTLAGKNTVTVKDVYVGEVWVASGQSNMEWPLFLTDGAAEAIKAAKHPQL